MMSADRLRVALIGCGFQGHHLAAALTDSERCELAVCCDTDAARAEALASALPHAPRVVDDWEAAIHDPAVDAVVVATTTHTHLELALATTAAGRHLLLEKPMAATVADCLAIERAAAEHGVVLMVGYKFRFAPAVAAAKARVPHPVVVTAHTMYDASQETSGWVNDPALSGGRLTSSLVHSVDLMRDLAGSEIVRVQAEGGNLAIAGLGQPDNAVATVRFANGSIGALLHGSAGRSELLSNWSFQTIGVGTNATIHDHGRQAVLHTAGAETEFFADPVADPFQVGMRPMVDEFAGAVAAGRAHNATARDGTAALAICRAVEAAIATGEPQDLAPLH